ncbi:MAG: hypothetical protein ACK5OB_09305 [Pirellula sp.]
MQDNPYRSPSPLHEEGFTLEPPAASAGKQVLPRLFWRIWSGYTLLGFVGMVHGISSGSSIVWNLCSAATFLSPFILFRAVRCERFQHKCVVFHGVSLFLTQWAICFGLFYLSLALMIVPVLWLGRWNPVVSTSYNPSTAPTLSVAWMQVLLVGAVWLALYLGLLELSAHRPRLAIDHPQNDTALDATH